METDVIVIGGGSTGAGIIRDCALRGLNAVLLERYDISTGATGRNHGLLHSGARYAVTDGESAKECIKENIILKRIAAHCIEETDGLFLTLPEDDLNFQSQFIRSCQAAGIHARAIEVEEALRLEPAANKTIIGAVRVPDGAIDPFRLTAANILDATEHNAQVFSYHEVTQLIRQNDRVIGVIAFDHKTKQKKNFYATVVINAAGIWGHHIAGLADININMLPSKGSLLIFGHRVNNMVLNRCRKPANADILVPGDTISIIGTTSEKIPYDAIDKMFVSEDDVNLLLNEGAKLAPELKYTRILRAYAGVRPLVANDNDPSGRNVSRGIVLFDHAKRDGLEGFITITGGKLMTYRLMAEWATDLVCKKLNVTARCTTADKPLPGSELPKTSLPQKILPLPKQLFHSATNRHGSRVNNIINDRFSNSLVCECESVSVGEIHYAINNLDIHNLLDLRRRTRIGMGTCQGEMCACRSAALLNYFDVVKTEQALISLATFLNERWKGIRPISWQAALKESEFISWVYQGVCGLTKPSEEAGDQYEI